MFRNPDPARPNGDLDELHDRLAAVAATADRDPPPDPPRKQPKPGRTADGKFDRGNPGGPGNPFARQVASFREALYEAVSRDMLKDLAARLWAMAIGGNVAAARLLLQYLVGKPQDPPHPDRLDRDEWQCHQSDAVPGQEFNQLMASMPVGMAVHMAQGVWPIAAEYMIRRPMAEMFKDPAAEDEAPARPRKAKRDKHDPQEAPTRNGDIGATPVEPVAPTPAPAAEAPRRADPPRADRQADAGHDRPCAAAAPGTSAGPGRQQTAPYGGPPHAPTAPSRVAPGGGPDVPAADPAEPRRHQSGLAAPAAGPRRPPDPRPPSTNADDGDVDR